MSTKKLRGAQLKEYRHNLAMLKRKGLVSDKINAAKHKPTDYMLRQIRKYKPVLEGKAAVVKVSKEDAKKFSDDFAVKNRRVVVPKAEGEKVRYSKKTGQITGTRTQYGQKIKRRRLKIKTNEDIRRLEGKGIRFAIHFAGGTVYRFSFADGDNGIITFMETYEQRERNPFKNWHKYVEVEEVDDDDDDEGDDED